MSNGPLIEEPDRGLESSSVDSRATDQRLAFIEKPLETFGSIYDASTGEVAPCHSKILAGLQYEVASLPLVPADAPPDERYIAYDNRTLERIAKLGQISEITEDSTPCRLRLLDLIDGALSVHTHLAHPRKFIQLAEMAVRIAEGIEERTKHPYFTLANLRENPALPPDALAVPPLQRREDWQRYADLRTGRSRSGIGQAQAELEVSVRDKARFEQEMDALAAELETRVAEERIAKSSQGSRTPVLNRARATLHELRFSDVARTSRARFRSDALEKPVSSTVAIWIYNSVYTVLLDTKGDPLEIPGVAPYGVLVGSPGHEIVRRLQSPGLYVSLGPLASYQLRVNGPHKVQTLLFGGIFGMQRNVFGFSREELGAEVSKHELHNKLQDHLNSRYKEKTLAVLITDDAFNSGELTFEGLRRTVYKMIPLISGFLYEEVVARLAQVPEQISDLAESIIRDAIQEAVTDWAIVWLIKKVGKKVIPVVNAIAAISDAITGGDSELWRNVAACLIMAIRSGKPDDLVISSKVLSKIAAGEVGKAALSKIGSRLGKQVASSATSRGKKAPTAPRADEPAKGSPSEQGRQPEVGSGRSQDSSVDSVPTIDEPAARDVKPSTPAPTGRRGLPVEATHRQAPQMTSGRASEETGTGPEHRGARDLRAPVEPISADTKTAASTGERAKDSALPEPDPRPESSSGARQGVVAKPPTPSRDETGRHTDQRGVESRRSDGEPDDRAVATKGAVSEDVDLTKQDDVPKAARLHLSQQNPASLEAARRAGVPSEVLGDAYVMTRVDFDDVLPEGPRTGRRPPPAKPPEGRRVSKSTVQNREVEADLLLLESSGARLVDIRVDQTQVSAGGQRVGTNRPDLQLTVATAELSDGRRIYIEYDRSPPDRALYHARRILENDPAAIVVLKISDYEKRPPRRRPDPDIEDDK